MKAQLQHALIAAIKKMQIDGKLPSDISIPNEFQDYECRGNPRGCPKGARASRAPTRGEGYRQEMSNIKNYPNKFFC